MKYLALIYAAKGAGPDYGTPEFGTLIAEYEAVQKVYDKEDVARAGEGLDDTGSITTVKVRDGKTETMDGPFVETKEQLGGFYVFECDNLDEAIKYAAMIPSAKYGAVELHPVMDYGN